MPLHQSEMSQVRMISQPGVQFRSNRDSLNLLSQAKARDQGLHPGLLCAWQASLGLSFAAFPDLLAGSSTGRGAAVTGAGLYMDAL